jgi:hypothetical protein|tara:strand:+ start:2644 stop:2985 length:342 start_codon:yes stop_codon:yes gene_type:complete
MAVKKTLIEAVPSSEGGKVVRWDLTMKYEQGTEGKADYYTNEKRATVEATVEGLNGSTTTNFTPKAEGEWTKKELENLCPTAKWDDIFDQQYDSVIKNPKTTPVPNTKFAIPS